ncbi:MAG: restriction endonuclease [Ferruginibacter sp.]
MKWQAYEEVVKNIYKILGKKFGVSIVCFGSSCKKLGGSGVEHQIDVLTSHTDGVHTYFTAIECKYWDVKVNKDVVMKLNNIIFDCKFNKGVVVSKKGFTEDAIKFAEHSSVSLVELDEHNMINTSKLYINMEVSQAKLERVELVLIKENNEKYHGDFNGKSYANYYLELVNGNTKRLSDLAIKFLNEKALTAKLFSYTKETIMLDEGTILKSFMNTDSFPVQKIVFTGFKIMYTKLDFDYIENKVWLIMKNLFEKTDYGVSVNNDIEKIKKPSFTLAPGEKININYKFVTKDFL